MCCCIQVIYFLQLILYKGVREGRETFFDWFCRLFCTQKFDSLKRSFYISWSVSATYT